MITKKEIRTELGNINKLDKAHEVCRLNDDLQLLLQEEARHKMFNLLTRIERRFIETNVEEYKIEDLWEYRSGLNDYCTVDGEYHGIWAQINACRIFIKIVVL